MLGLGDTGTGHRTDEYEDETERTDLKKGGQAGGANTGAPWGNSGAPGINGQDIVIRGYGFPDGMSEG